MLVDMTLPRHIPAETALRMIRKVVQTVMYLRGQMATSWDQLEVLLMQENMRQEQEELEQGSQSHEGSFYDDPHLGTRNHAQDEDDDTGNDFVIPIKSLREVTPNIPMSNVFFPHLINSCGPIELAITIFLLHCINAHSS